MLDVNSKRRSTGKPKSVLSSRRSLLIPSASTAADFLRFGKSTSALALKNDWESLHLSHAAEQLAASVRDDASSVLSATSSTFPHRHTNALGTGGSPGVRSSLHRLKHSKAPSLARTATYASSSRGSVLSNVSSSYPQSFQSTAQRSYVSHSFENSTSEADHHASASPQELRNEIKSFQEEFQNVDESLKDLVRKAREKHSRHCSPSLIHEQYNNEENTTLIPDHTTIQYATIPSTIQNTDILLSPVRLKTRSLKTFMSPSSSPSSPQSSKKKRATSPSPTVAGPSAPHSSPPSPKSKRSNPFSRSPKSPAPSSPQKDPSSPNCRPIMEPIEFDSPSDEQAYREEVERVNQRRAKVAFGYSQKLEYLETRLKGALLRERLAG